MKKKQLILFIAVPIGLYLLYRWYQNQIDNATANGINAGQQDVLGF